MVKLSAADRTLLADLLTSGQDLPRDYKNLLFPPDRKECELVYEGKQREQDVLAETMALPLQPIRSFGANGSAGSRRSNNMLIFGDNLQALKTLLRMKDAGGLRNSDGSPGVRLIYIDPPFGTGDEYEYAEGEIAYSARLQGTRFIEFLRKRIIFLRELLSDDGSLFIRLDYHFGHYIKAVLDEVMGPQNFQNEIVINRFKRQLRGLTRFNVSTDSLFFYSKTGRPYFQEQERPRICSFCGQSKQPEWHHMVSSGLRNPPDRVILGRKLYPPRGQHWKYRQVKIDLMEKEDRIRINSKVNYTDINGRRVNGMPEFLQTEDAIVDSDWTDLRGYVLGARYPTENPEELLARVINTSSKVGDLVLDAFAGSGTTLAVAEKLGRRWIGTDCGKLAIYTIQKRMLNLSAQIGNKGQRLKNKPFVLFNSGLYDFSKLKRLEWEDWRFFALSLFQCRDEAHSVRGIKFDGYREADDVLVFDHTLGGGAVLDYGYVDDLHSQLAGRTSSYVFIIAPAASVVFLEDYLDRGRTKYYILRIPYSIINELHHKDFEALLQPVDELHVNETVESVGFDFIRPPKVECEYFHRELDRGEYPEAVIKITSFHTEAMVKGASQRASFEALAMVLIDADYPADKKPSEAPHPFELDAFYFARELEHTEHEIRIPMRSLGKYFAAVFVDVYGNEYTEVKASSVFEQTPKTPVTGRAKP